MPSRNKTFFLAIILAIVFSFFRGTFDSQPISSAFDDKQYKYLQLSNSLRVLLISDKEADHGAASLDVHVGSLQDPAARPGLAHFLEHMLFLGTKTYPEAGEYQSFISQHGGHHNAFTAAEHTNYFFQIDDQHLEGALQRFSRFFYEPLFTEEYVQREKEAVNSEYKSKYKDDYRRMQYVGKALMNPEHPASQFATGNLKTLSDNDSSKIRDDLLAFYDHYYSANLMTLTIYGPQDLKTLTVWAKQQFSPIVNRQAKRNEYPEQLFLNAPQDVKIQPVKELLSLNFSFELGADTHHSLNKPTQYIGHILGHEGEGSLLAWLKQKGWAEGLSAGLGNRMDNNGVFHINISLTQLGTEHVDTISTQLFAYINLLKSQGIEQWVFDELKQLDQLHFTFAQGQQPARLVQSLSMQMHEYDAENILRGPYYWESFDSTRIKRVLTKLTPSNVIRTQISPKVNGSHNETWFNAPYDTGAIAETLLQQWQAPSLAQGLHLPKANPFIPESVDVLPQETQTQPQLMTQQAGFDVWHLQDVSFDGPQSSIYVSLRSPLVTQTPQNKVLSEAWVQLLNDHLNSFSYPALLAGQSYSLYSHMRGLGMRLHGYRDKQNVVLNKVANALVEFQPSQDKWQQIKQQLIRGYQNALKQKPFERSIAQVNQALIQPSFNEQQLLTAIENSELQQLNAFKDRFFDELEVVILGHGNIDEADLQVSSALIKETLLSTTQAIDVPRAKVNQLNSLREKDINAQHNDKAMTWYFQAQSDDQQERALLGLIGQIIKAPYYTYMRTEKKYGYVVFATPYPMLEQGGLVFIVQSPSSSSALLKQETEQYLTGFSQQLMDMSEQDFLSHRQSLVNNLLKKPLNLQEKTNRLWADIDKENYQFNSKQVLADHVASLQKQQLIDYVEQYLLGDKQKSLLLTYDGQ